MRGYIGTMEKEDRLKGFEALLGNAAGNANALASLSLLFGSDGWKSRAAEVAAQALALPNGSEEARMLARHVVSTDVPAWHFVIVQDIERNQAYDDALRRAVTPESRVLEIGAGSGLLAMMAARAGAAHVFTCEIEPAIAQAAQDIIGQNGLNDRITVINKHSKDVQPEDLGGPVDILVQEIVSNEMLGEGVLPALQDAMQRLVKPGGSIIPASGTIRVALACHDSLPKPIGTVSGFDLSPFDRLREPNFRIPTDTPHLKICSDAVDLFAFDFTSGGPWEGDRATTQITASDTIANGIVQWITLDMDTDGRYENRPSPDAPRSAWAAVFHAFERDHSMQPGQSFVVCGQHDLANVRLWIDDGKCDTST